MVKSSHTHNNYNCCMNIQLQLQLFTIPLYLCYYLQYTYFFVRRAYHLFNVFLGIYLGFPVAVSMKIIA